MMTEEELVRYRLRLEQENLAKPLDQMLPVDEMTDEQILAHLKSREWLEEHAASIRRTYEELLEAATRYLDHGEYLVGNYELEGVWTPDEFWDHFQIVTGRAYSSPDEDWGYGTNFYSCSC